MKTAAYPLLHGAKLDAFFRLYPRLYPEIKPELRTWMKLACARMGVSVPSTTDPCDKLYSLRLLSGRRQEKMADIRVSDTAKERKAKRKKAKEAGYRKEYSAQLADLDYFLWWGWWKGE